MSKPAKQEKRVVFTSNPKFSLKRQRFDAAGQVTEAAEGEEKVTLEGYAMVWNALSDDRGGFKVRLLKDSAKFTTPTFALFHHDFKVILGSTANGTLRLTADDIGVRFESDLPATTTAADVVELVEDKYVSGMSFSMLYDDVLVTTEKTEDGQDIVEVAAFTCDEITVTAKPAFVQTSIGIQEDDEEEDDADPPAAERMAQSIRLAQLDLSMRKL